MRAAPWRSVMRALARCELEQCDLMPTPCWRFAGAINADGYGRIGWCTNGVKGYALLHRAVYSALAGPIPEGLDLDHLCRNRACCNPSHAEPVTRRVNLLRGDTIPARNAASTTCPRGHDYEPFNGRERRCLPCRAARARKRRATAKTHRLTAGGTP